MRIKIAESVIAETISLVSDQKLISPYNITAWSGIEVRRINDFITKDKMLWSLKKFPQLVLQDSCGEQ